jgi:hypothetical protein
MIALAAALVGLASAVLDLPRRYREATGAEDGAARTDSIRQKDSITRSLKSQVATVRARVDSIEETTPSNTPHVTVHVVNTCESPAKLAINYVPVLYSRPVTRGWYHVRPMGHDTVEAWVKGASFGYFAEYANKTWSRDQSDGVRPMYVYNDVFADDGTVVWEGRGVRSITLSIRRIPRKVGSTVFIDLACN